MEEPEHEGPQEEVAPTPGMSGGGYVRFPGWRTYLLLLALPLSSVLLYELIDPAAMLGDFAKSGLGPEAEVAGWTTGVLLTLAPIAILIPLIAKLHKLFGGARWDERGLFLRGPLIKEEVFLPWESVQTLEVISTGVQVVPTKEAAPGLWTFYPFRPLIPVEGAERDRVLEAVAGRAGRVQEGRIFGYTPHPWRSALIAFVIALPCVVAVMFTNAAIVQDAWATSADYLVLGATLTTLVVGVGGALFSTSAFLTRIEVREGLLTCASFAFPFEELRASIDGQAAWFESPSQKKRGYLRAGEGPALRELLQAAGVEVGDHPPRRARSSAVLLQASALIAIGLVTGAVPAIWASLQPAHDVDQLWDPFLQGAVLVHERWTGRPVHLVLTAHPERFEVRGREAYSRPGLLVGGDPLVRVHAIEGTWSVPGGATGSLAPLTSQVGSGAESALVALPLDEAALARLQATIAEQRYEGEVWPRHPGAGGTPAIPQAVRGAGRTVPGFLEHLLGVPEGPLGDYVRGRTSRRFYDVQGADGDLVAAVCNGRVLWVVALPPEVGVTLEGAGFGYGTALGAPRTLVEPGISRSNLTGALELLRQESPTLEQLLEARRRIESKQATVEQTLTWLRTQPPGN